MKTPKIQLVMRAVAAVAVALAGSFLAVPALAETGPAEPAPAAPSPSAASPSATAGPAATSPAPDASPAQAPAAPAVSDAGLADAVRRDLGMTMEEFNAAGEQAKRAADAVASLRALPGYVGTSLKDGRIVVEGSGAELEARVDDLNHTGPTADFVLVAPAVALPLKVPSAAELIASNTDQLFGDYVREVGAAGLQAVAYTDGHFVIRAGGTTTAEAALPAVLDPQGPPAAAETPAPGKISAAEFVARYANVQLEKGARITTEADVYGGEGYFIDASPWRTICSTGFGAYSAAGLPVVLTAGHCAEDGTAAVIGLEPPTSSVAGGSLPLPGTLAPLGSFGFSQFGGPLNTWITGAEKTPGNVGTDIAVIQALTSGINVQPAATTWASTTNPGPSAVKIIGTVAPVKGQEVCRSGRTTGWSCGQVEETGVYVVGGRTTAAGDLRAFRGFLSKNVQSSGGDSGGPWISGNFAVGTHSAGESSGENFAIATTLEDSITKIEPKVELQLFLNKPELVAPENLTFKAGQPIAGRVPAAPASDVAANSKVRVTVGSEAPVDVPVDPEGNWAYPVPPGTSALAFTAETVNGFSHSGAAQLAVKFSDLDAPVIAAPEGGAALTSLSRIDGTGTAGLTVKLTGDITGSAVVGPDGNWTFPVAGPVYGQIAVHAVQTGQTQVDSPSVTRNFTVTPAAPAAASIVDGLHFSTDSLPETISGTGIDGAEVAVSVDGFPVGAAQAGAGGAGAGARAVVRSMIPQVLVLGGRWSVPFPSGLAAGMHTLSVTQSVDGIASVPLLVTFTIDAPVLAAVQPAAVPLDPAVGPLAAYSARPGQLPNTGAGPILPTAGLAGATLLLGGALLVLVRRRTPKAVPAPS